MTRHGLFDHMVALQRCRPKGRLARFEKRKDLSRENPPKVTAKRVEPTLLCCLPAWLNLPFAAVWICPRPAAKNKTP
ncbi:hypothetical protein LA5096_01145 [Roseibium album]|uniref:Uncharacterized protein n=1 Tax=Roseibium album TaxID=311410 RepID=A0A0M6ZWE1_9HYPH|nr:hypothetical protein LA5096_01145 [Roseibium album]